MAQVTKSGIYYDKSGQLMLVTQGLGGYTLVTYKKILFRLYTELPQSTAPAAVLATITYRLGLFKLKRTVLISGDSLLIERGGCFGDSIGIIFSGDVFPFSSSVRCSVEFDVFGTTSHFELNDIVFLPSGRLRLMIHNISGTAPWRTVIVPNFSWLVDMFQSLERLSAMMPIRDGVRFGLSHSDAGLCFVFGENVDPWPAVCPSGAAPPCTGEEMLEYYLRETTDINLSGGAERIDATVVWRPRDLLYPAAGGESTGGSAHYYDSPPGTGLAGFVGGERSGLQLTAPLLAQEVGHLFGLVPRDSPHSDGGGHSKDPRINDPFAFDFYLLKAYQPATTGFLGDVMSWAWSQGRDMVLYNAFDWEHLRQKLAKLRGVARSASRGMASKQSHQSMTDELNSSFPTATELNVRDLTQTLPRQKSRTWHWTERGFQAVERGAKTKNRSALSASVECLRSWLEELDVTHFYAPVGENFLSMVLHPNAQIRLDRTGFLERTGLPMMQNVTQAPRKR